MRRLHLKAFFVTGLVATVAIVLAGCQSKPVQMSGYAEGSWRALQDLNFPSRGEAEVRNELGPQAVANSLRELARPAGLEPATSCVCHWD